MSNCLSELDKIKFAYHLKITDPPLSYANKENLDRFSIALSIEIPCPLLHFWYGIAGRQDEEGNTMDFLDLLNEWIPSKCFQISRASGFRIEGRIRRQASLSVSKFMKAPGSRKKNELNSKTYTLSVLVNELVNVGELQAKLKQEEEQANDVVEEWRQKYENLESEKDRMLDEICVELERRNNEINELDQTLTCEIQKNTQLQQKVLDLEKLPIAKPFNQLGERQKLRRLKSVKSKASMALWFLESYGLTLSSLKAKQSDTGKTVSFDYDSEDGNTADKETVEQMLFLLDKFCSSDEMYHELAIHHEDLPRSYLIKQKRSDLNKLSHVEMIPGKHPGAQIPFVDTLSDHVRQLLECDQNYGIDDPIKVKISCDGAKMSRSTNFVILSFALLQSGSQVMSSKGNRTLAIVNGPENYDTIKDSMQNIINEINSVASDGKIKIDGKDRNVELFLGGDTKFLLMAMGMKGATSDYACLWCKIHKLCRWDTSKDIGFYNSGEMKRTLKDIKNCHSKNQYSCCQNPLFSINLDHIILDELHLMLRITDRLLENLIMEVMEKDSKEDFLKTNKQAKSVNLDKLIETINSLGVSFSIWEKPNADGKGSGSYDWTSLTGSDKKKVLYQLPSQLETLDVLFLETKPTVIKLWKDFGCVYQLISNSSIIENENLPEDIFGKSKDFVELFCSLASSRIGYQKCRVTPYMHALVYHVPVFVRNYHSLKQKRITTTPSAYITRSQTNGTQ